MDDIKNYDDELISDFLKVHLFRITIAGLLGFLDKWIKARITKATDEELLKADIDLWGWTMMEGDDKVSLGRRKLRLLNHPLHKALVLERLRRDREKELLDPNSYLNPLHELSDSEIRNYLIWKAEVHGTVMEWRRDKRRSLPVIKREGDSSIRIDPSRDQSSIQTSQKAEVRAYSPGAGKKKEKI